MIPLHYPEATTQSCMTHNMSGQILFPGLWLNVNLQQKWDKHWNHAIPEHQECTFCCCTACFHRSLVTGNTVFLYMFLPVLQCCRWEQIGKQIVLWFMMSKTGLCRDLQIYSWDILHTCSAPLQFQSLRAVQSHLLSKICSAWILWQDV